MITPWKMVFADGSTIVAQGRRLAEVIGGVKPISASWKQGEQWHSVTPLGIDRAWAEANGRTFLIVGHEKTPAQINGYKPKRGA